MASEPALDLCMFMGGVVVDDQVKVEPWWGFSIDFVEESDPFLMSMARHALTNHAAFEHVQRGEECGCPIPLVVVSHGSAAALLDRKTRLSAVEGLNL